MKNAHLRTSHQVYFNLKDYFTIRNIPFSTVEKRKGGEGRLKNLMSKNFQDPRYRALQYYARLRKNENQIQ